MFCWLLLWSCSSALCKSLGFLPCVDENFKFYASVTKWSWLLVLLKAMKFFIYRGIFYSFLQWRLLEWSRCHVGGVQQSLILLEHETYIYIYIKQYPCSSMRWFFRNSSFDTQCRHLRQNFWPTFLKHRFWKSQHFNSHTARGEWYGRGNHFLGENNADSKYYPIWRS